jgi:hypothetical protein
VTQAFKHQQTSLDSEIKLRQNVNNVNTSAQGLGLPSW